ncbi:hypothetical protein IWX90DRAFT_324027 [Phyllosticta citrichinensis]|uniref:Uncharacterized protein n=1 Tax=Phyllosticta citrichinensis TaxID=1130410 RepID=A0ABR1XK87_9PEZI
MSNPSCFFSVDVPFFVLMSAVEVLQGHCFPFGIVQRRIRAPGGGDSSDVGAGEVLDGCPAQSPGALSMQSSETPSSFNNDISALRAAFAQSLKNGKTKATTICSAECTAIESKAKMAEELCMMYSRNPTTPRYNWILVYLAAPHRSRVPRLVRHTMRQPDNPTTGQCGLRRLQFLINTHFAEFCFG